MVSLPDGISLADLQKLTSLLLASGASVDEINTIRKHIESLKGGKLARQAFPAPLVTLILSDVVGDPLEVIGSGPSVPDPTTYSDALNILQKYDILEAAPQSIRAHLELGRRGRFLKRRNLARIFRNVRNILIGSNELVRSRCARRRSRISHAATDDLPCRGARRRAGCWPRHSPDGGVTAAR
jgi:hydroxypyruvate reductase